MSNAFKVAIMIHEYEIQKLKESISRLVEELSKVDGEIISQENRIYESFNILKGKNKLDDYTIELAQKVSLDKEKRLKLIHNKKVLQKEIDTKNKAYLELKNKVKKIILKKNNLEKEIKLEVEKREFNESVEAKVLQANKYKEN